MEAVLKNADGGVAVLLANLGRRAATGRFSLSQLHIVGKSVTIYNVWTGSTSIASRLAYRLQPGHTALLVLKDVGPSTATHQIRSVH
ncbi:MAG: hypothetical protein ACRDNS_02920 [Trebonia sp.]